MRIRSTTRKKDSQDTTRAIISRTKRVLCSMSAAGRRATVRIRRTAKRWPRPRLRPSPPTHPPHKVFRCRRRSAGHKRPPAHPLPPALATGGAAREFAQLRGAAAAQRLWGRPPGRPGARSAGCSKTRPAFIIARWEERRASRPAREPCESQPARGGCGAGRVTRRVQAGAGPGRLGGGRGRARARTGPGGCGAGRGRPGRARTRAGASLCEGRAGPGGCGAPLGCGQVRGRAGAGPGGAGPGTCGAAHVRALLGRASAGPGGGGAGRRRGWAGAGLGGFGPFFWGRRGLARARHGVRAHARAGLAGGGSESGERGDGRGWAGNAAGGRNENLISTYFKQKEPIFQPKRAQKFVEKMYKYG